MKMIDYIKDKTIVEVEYYNNILFNLIDDVGVYYGVDFAIDVPYGLELLKTTDFTIVDGILRYESGDEPKIKHVFNLNELDALI
jgi:hypothetical protein